MGKTKTGLSWDEWDEQVSESAKDEAQAMYRAGKLENCMNDVCKGAFNYIKLYPDNPDKDKWKKLYQEANAIRDQYKKIREIL